MHRSAHQQRRDWAVHAYKRGGRVREFSSRRPPMQDKRRCGLLMCLLMCSAAPTCSFIHGTPLLCVRGPVAARPGARRTAGSLSMQHAPAPELASTQRLKKPVVLQGQDVPNTMHAAVRRFFLGEENAPRFLVAALVLTGVLRICSGGVGAVDVSVIGGVALFWAFQEWWMHKYLLHAPFEWLGTGKFFAVASCRRGQFRGLSFT
jgi:hypothetical protein